MAQRRLDSFFRSKVPRPEKGVDNDGNSGEDGDEEDNREFKIHVYAKRQTSDSS